MRIWFDDKADHEKNIKKMEEIEKIEGFMFWNASPEGEEYYKGGVHLVPGEATKTTCR
jgi:hypothetical protein